MSCVISGVKWETKANEVVDHFTIDNEKTNQLHFILNSSIDFHVSQQLDYFFGLITRLVWIFAQCLPFSYYT